MSMLPVTSTAEAERVIELLRDTVALICKTSLNYNTELSVEGTIGVTLDKTQMFLVNVREIFHQGSTNGDKSRDYLLNPALAAANSAASPKPGKGKRKRKKQATKDASLGEGIVQEVTNSTVLHAESGDESSDMFAEGIKQEPPDEDAEVAPSRSKRLRSHTGIEPLADGGAYMGAPDQGFPTDAMDWFSPDVSAAMTPTKYAVYESKRVRKWNAAWTRQFSWLSYSEAENKMFCEICRGVYAPYSDAPDDGSVPRQVFKIAQLPFVKGCSNFKKSVLSSHLLSTGHQDAEKIQESADGNTLEGIRKLYSGKQKGGNSTENQRENKSPVFSSRDRNANSEIVVPAQNQTQINEASDDESQTAEANSSK